MVEYVLYIVRGVPGSGKSDIAKLLAPDCNFAANDYFYDKQGNYNYDPKKLEQAHKSCFKNVQNAMMDGKPIVVVANTFVHKDEYLPYIETAEKLGYTPVEIICKGNFSSIYNIPDGKIKSMLSNFEY